MKRFDKWLAKYIRRILLLPDIITRPQSNANPEGDGHYVIVDVSINTLYSLGHPVLPNEMPETYPTLGEAMDQAVRLHEMLGYDANTAKIFRLIEVDLAKLYGEIKAENREEENEKQNS